MSLRGLVGSEAKDDARRLNEQLNIELSQAQDDMKRLRQAVDQLSREYENSKEVDAFRRYSQLKRVIKRAIMHLKLHQTSVSDDQGSTGAPSVVRGGKEELRKRTDYATGLSTQELAGENEDLAEQIKECRRKTSTLRILIEELEHSYEDSKRFVPIQRYRLMKSMVKRVTQSNLL